MRVVESLQMDYKTQGLLLRETLCVEQGSLVVATDITALLPQLFGFFKNIISSNKEAKDYAYNMDR